MVINKRQYFLPWLFSTSYNAGLNIIVMQCVVNYALFTRELS